MLRATLVLLSLNLGTAVQAENFATITSRDSFVQLIEGRELARFGIRLNVTNQGDIVGRAFGTPVTGRWTWTEEFFCRDLLWGDRDLGSNCQQVEVNGDTLRFTTDRGDGIYADLRLM